MVRLLVSLMEISQPLCVQQMHVANVLNLASGTSIDGVYGGVPVSFACAAGFAPSHETVTCGSDGSFNETVTCVAATCSAIVVNNSNSIINDTTYDGTGAQTTTVECNDGFSGGGTYTCSASGTTTSWTGAACVAQRRSNSRKYMCCLNN